MNFLKLVLFESPFWLGVFSFLLFAVVLFARPRWSASAARYSLPATLAAIVLLFVIQSFVTTQRERILQALDALVAAVEHRDIAALRSVMSPRYQSEDMGQEDIVACIGSVLRRIKIQDTRLARRDVTIDGGRAEMILAVRATVSTRGGVGEFHSGRWRISWLNEPGGWKIIALRPETLDNYPIDSLRTLTGHVP